MRALKSTTISFGMVVMPVKVYPGTVKMSVGMFNQIHTECGSRIKMPKSCPKCNRTLEAGEITKGYSLGKGPDGQEKFLMITEEDLASIPLQTARNIAIDAFVPSGSITDPRWFDDLYFLSPEESATRPYALFAKTMEACDVYGVAKVCLKEEKEHLCVIRPINGMLAMQILRWADELRDYREIMVSANVTEKEMTLAKTLITAMTKEVNLADYHDEYRLALLELIAAKLDGKVITAPPVVKQAEPDMVEALMASLKAVGAKTNQIFG
jgi:DNA end-binding protein Ku